MLTSSYEKARKNIMTEPNVAFRIRRDLFVIGKIKKLSSDIRTAFISRRVRLATPLSYGSLPMNGGPHG
jgi:hypothetical protein